MTRANTHEVEGARFRGGVYRLLAHALRYPDDAWLTMLSDEQHWTALLQSAGPGDAQLSDLLSGVRDDLPALASCRGGLSAGRLAELQLHYMHLFGHAVRGSCPLYELEYGPRDIVQQAPLLADIAGFYVAFGMQLTEDAHERADHLAVECEFLSVLAEKAACALEADDAEGLEIVQNAQRSFLTDHLGRWLPSLVRRIQLRSPNAFYGRLAALASRFIADECRRLGVEPEPRFLQVTPVNPPADSSIECGGGLAAVPAHAEPLVQLGVSGEAAAR